MHISIGWPPMWARTQNESQNLLTKPTYTSLYTKCFSTCVNHTHAVQLVLTKAITWLWVHKIYLNLCWPNPFHAIENSKCISTCIEQTSTMPAKTQNSPQTHQTPIMLARTQNASQHMLTNPFHARENKKCISTCVDQNHSMPVRTQNGYQQVLTKTRAISARRLTVSQVVLCKHIPC